MNYFCLNQTSKKPIKAPPILETTRLIPRLLLKRSGDQRTKSKLEGSNTRCIIQKTFSFQNMHRLFGIFTRPERELTATASVGPNAAPKAKQAASGHWATGNNVAPTPTRVKILLQMPRTKLSQNF